MYGVHCILYTILHCTPYNIVQCTPYYSLQCTAYTIQRTLYAIQYCTAYIDRLNQRLDNRGQGQTIEVDLWQLIPMTANLNLTIIKDIAFVDRSIIETKQQTGTTAYPYVRLLLSLTPQAELNYSMNGHRHRLEYPSVM